MVPSPAARQAIAGLLFLWAPIAAADVGLDDLTAQVTLTSDYVFRGLSQSREDPAIQGGFEFRHDTGFFAGIWASSVDFPNNRLRSQPRDLELDYYVGYGVGLGPAWSGSAQLTRYTYPGDDPAFEYDYAELALSVQLRDALSGSVHVSNDLFGRGERAVAYELSGRRPLGARVDGLAGLGVYDLDRVTGDSYAYWNLGLSFSLERFALDLAYIDTSTEARAMFGAEVAGSRWVASLTAHFD